MDNIDVWKYFNKCEPVDGVEKASCSLCEKVLNALTSNLKIHLTSQHFDVFTGSDKKLAKTSRKLIWVYFTSLEGNRKAQCNVCGSVLSYKTSVTNLKTHLVGQHTKAYERFIRNETLEGAEFENGEKLSENCEKLSENVDVGNNKCDISTGSDKNPAKNSGKLIWVYFTSLDGTKAKCNVCGSVRSYKTSVTNLKTHLMRKHRDAYKKFLRNEPLEDIEFDTDGNGDTDVNSDASEPEAQDDIWNYFERETGGRVRCVVCRASLSERTKDLSAHLREKHPKLAGQESASDTEDKDAYTEVVYLEDPIPTPPRKRENVSKFLSKSLHKKQKSSPKRHRRESSSSDEYLLKINNKNDEEIDKFGKYVTCLLKTVPKDVCTKLQMDIVNMIMSAKLNCQKSKDGAAVSVNVNSNIVQNLDTVYQQQQCAGDKFDNSERVQVIELANLEGGTTPVNRTYAKFSVVRSLDSIDGNTSISSNPPFSAS